ncbi:putative quinol monooxygenase [Lactobacillus terrae]|uniref:putative quinol monooxygenase n=1 Tax=Lactobacillus terrae TaxID=2269374 RepID=UPI00318466D6
MFELDPELLTEKKAPIQELYNAQTSVRLAKIKIDTTNAGIFKNVVFEEMKTAVEVESSVFLMYAGSLNDDPSKWIFFEIYQDNKAYLKHLETDHFKKYISGTKNIVLEKQLYELKPNTLANKGGLFYQSK